MVTDTQSNSNDEDQFPFLITRTSSFKQRYVAFKRADVVLFMNFTFAGVPVALLSGTPIVLSHHGVYRFSGSLKTQLIEFAKRQLTRFFRNISVSQFVANNIPGESVVIPNAYDDALFKPSAMERRRDFVFCGRLVSDKGADVLIAAFKQVVQEFPHATLTIIGDGPYRLKLESSAQPLNGNQIQFSGILRGQALVNKLQEHACMVIPSLWEEPFGIVALEGIASCDIVISSNRGGLPEAVGECGVLIAPSVENLAKAMRDVLKSYAEEGAKIRPSDQVRELHLVKHRPSIVAQSYLSVCKEALSK